VLYYSAFRQGSNSAVHCIGTATSIKILGPYTPQSDYFACPQSQGGAIDPASFHDTGGYSSRYALYKFDGNSIGHGGNCENTFAPIQPTPIMIQKVDSDGITKIGRRIQLLDHSEADGSLIEPPAMFYSNGIYYLLFCSNCCDKTFYDVSNATSYSLTGGFTRRAVRF
jgi:beta-xylosidase